MRIKLYIQVNEFLQNECSCALRFHDSLQQSGIKPADNEF